jgi:hypothetical protein
MNEQYLFCGKRKDNGEWVEGDLMQWGDEIMRICVDTGNDEKTATTVIPETVGRCTGLKDKNGKLIFEGDILKGLSYPFLSDGEYNYYAIVVWFENSPAFGTCTVKNPQAKVRGISDGDTNYMDDWNSNDWEVIGNIHDNKELLEVQNG